MALYYCYIYVILSACLAEIFVVLTPIYANYSGLLKEAVIGRSQSVTKALGPVGLRNGRGVRVGWGVRDRG